MPGLCPALTAYNFGTWFLFRFAPACAATAWVTGIAVGCRAQLAKTFDNGYSIRPGGELEATLLFCMAVFLGYKKTRGCSESKNWLCLLRASGVGVCAGRNYHQEPATISNEPRKWLIPPQQPATR